MSSSKFETLVDDSRRVASIYAQVRDERLPIEERFTLFKRRRDELFAHHPQSPIERKYRSGFKGLAYFRYDPRTRFLVEPDTDVVHEVFEVALREDGVMRMRRTARTRFSLYGKELSLSLFWIIGYGGGLFLPFRDATNGTDTYGGGRYLLDTAQHADLGEELGRLIVDFNLPRFREAPHLGDRSSRSTLVAGHHPCGGVDICSVQPPGRRSLCDIESAYSARVKRTGTCL